MRPLRDQGWEGESPVSRVRKYVEDLSGPDVVRIQAPPGRAPFVGRRHAAATGGHAMMSSMRGVTKRIQSIKLALRSPDALRRMSVTKTIPHGNYHCA